MPTGRPRTKCPQCRNAWNTLYENNNGILLPFGHGCIPCQIINVEPPTTTYGNQPKNESILQHYETEILEQLQTGAADYHTLVNTPDQWAALQRLIMQNKIKRIRSGVYALPQFPPEIATKKDGVIHARKHSS